MSDLIERQKAIEALKDWYDGMIISSFRGIEKVIKALPSAELEIIHCRDCKHYHYEKNIPYCDRIDYGYGWKDNDYCSRAERRTDAV